MIRTSMVGAAVSAQALRDASTAAGVAPRELREEAGRTWIELPIETGDAPIAAIAAAIGCELYVVQVDLPERTRGAGVTARSFIAGHPERQDLTAAARALVHEFTASPDDATLHPDYEHLAAGEIGWRLIADGTANVPPAFEDNLEDRWAKALLERLLEVGAIELRSKQHAVVEGLAHTLQFADGQLGQRLMDELMSAKAVDEVFVDADELAAHAAVTRPR